MHATKSWLALVLHGCDWLREWPRIFGPITEGSKANPIHRQSRITFDIELKIALSYEMN